MSESFCPACGAKDTAGYEIVSRLDELKESGFKPVGLIMNRGTLHQLSRGFSPLISDPDLTSRGFYGMPIRIDNTLTKIRIEVET